jgi:uncharacterized protein (TIGR04255 family)
MVTWEHFPKAPIVEALIDLQVTFASPVDLTRLEAFHQAIKEEYPLKQSRVKWHGEIKIGKPEPQQTVQRGPEGFMFKSRDGKRLVQVRQDGYTFNWLKPYPTWPVFRDQARTHWERYSSTYRPETISRLGLRYINRIEIPLPFNDFRDFVRTAPDVAEGLPQGLSGLFMRLELPDAKRRILAIVTEAMEVPIDVDGVKRLPLIFDIDIVDPTKFIDPASSSIWDRFEEMREYKNEIFFGSLTERTKEMFR